MATKRYNFTFKDGFEYETTIYEGGGICIKSDFGGKILELGHWKMLDVLEILDSIRDELKRADERYDNPIVKKEAERMDGEELTLIMNYPCRFHSEYKGWEIYRAWDIVNDHGRMLYFASGITPEGGLTILQAKNLSGIKARVSEVA